MVAHWRDREIDYDHPHGTDYWYRRGCRCGLCMEWRRREYRKSDGFYKRRRAMEGSDVFAPAAPTIRRLRALACLGWSASEISERSGYSEIHISRTRRGVNGDAVRVSLHTKIRQIYDELSMTKRDTHHGRKTMAIARKNGWKPPLAYDEGELDAARV